MTTYMKLAGGSRRPRRWPPSALPKKPKDLTGEASSMWDQTAPQLLEAGHLAKIIFLHRIVEGGTDRSYGIHVARLAGVPKTVLERARQLLGELAVHHVGQAKLAKHSRQQDESQMQLFVDPMHEIAKELAGTQLDGLTPMQAFDLLRQWKQKLGG